MCYTLVRSAMMQKFRADLRKYDADVETGREFETLARLSSDSAFETLQGAAFMYLEAK